MYYKYGGRRRIQNEIVITSEFSEIYVIKCFMAMEKGHFFVKIKFSCRTHKGQSERYYAGIVGKMAHCFVFEIFAQLT